MLVIDPLDNISWSACPDRGRLAISLGQSLVRIGRVDQKLTRAENLQKCSLLYTISHISVSLTGPGPFGYQPRSKSWSGLGILTKKFTRAETWKKHSLLCIIQDILVSLPRPGPFGYQTASKSWSGVDILV